MTFFHAIDNKFACSAKIHGREEGNGQTSQTYLPLPPPPPDIRTVGVALTRLALAACEVVEADALVHVVVQVVEAAQGALGGAGVRRTRGRRCKAHEETGAQGSSTFMREAELTLNKAHSYEDVST